jgi:galactoside O-acetyltransferase
MPVLSRAEVEAMGFKSLGKNVSISDKASFWNPGNISIGDNSRIDDFCVLSAGIGGIRIGRYVHVAVFCSLIGAAEIVLEDFSCTSGRVSVYSSSDDFSGPYMSNSTIPDKYKNVTSGPVYLRKHALVGAGSLLLPNTDIGEGSRVNAMSLVYGTLKEYTQYGGIPVRAVRSLPKVLPALEKAFLEEQGES